jgi:hypothetical protein
VGLIGATLLLTFRRESQSSSSVSNRSVSLGERPGH